MSPAFPCECSQPDILPPPRGAFLIAFSALASSNRLFCSSSGKYDFGILPKARGSMSPAFPCECSRPDILPPPRGAFLIAFSSLASVNRLSCSSSDKYDLGILPPRYGLGSMALPCEYSRPDTLPKARGSIAPAFPCECSLPDILPKARGSMSPAFPCECSRPDILPKIFSRTRASNSCRWDSFSCTAICRSASAGKLCENFSRACSRSDSGLLAPGIFSNPIFFYYE